MTISYLIKKFVAPALPTAPINYDQRRDDQLNYSLRLYFNLLDNYLATISGPLGGGVLGIPHISASDSTDQYADGNNDPTIVKWNTLDSGNGFTLAAPGTATCQISGVYKITFSIQIANTANALHDAVFWLKVNNVDVANSATVFTLPSRKSSGSPSFFAGYSEITFEVNAGDDIELWWATDLAYNPTGPVDGVYLFHDAAQTSPYVRPAIPSAIGSITFVSALTA
jgi:hypothetical protein